VILHLPRPQSDDSASGNDAASEGDDEQARGHGGGEIASRGSRHSSTIPVGDRPVAPVRTAGAGRVLDDRLRGSL